MKKLALIFLFIIAGGIVYAGGSMDVSSVSDADVARIERIVEALDPEVAIESALNSFGQSSFPMSNYLETQKMRINRIFNEYGIEFSEYADFEGLNSRSQVTFSRLKSRYSYLNSLTFKNPNELRAILALLKD